MPFTINVRPEGKEMTKSTCEFKVKCSWRREVLEISACGPRVISSLNSYSFTIESLRKKRQIPASCSNENIGVKV